MSGDRVGSSKRGSTFLKVQQMFPDLIFCEMLEKSVRGDNDIAIISGQLGGVNKGSGSEAHRSYTDITKCTRHFQTAGQPRILAGYFPAGRQYTLLLTTIACKMQIRTMSE